MNITDYYNEAKNLLNRFDGGFPELHSALNYDSENDHPSLWIPNVQCALIEYFKLNPKNELSDEILELYIQGEIMESNADGRTFICFALGLLFGWFFFDLVPTRSVGTRVRECETTLFLYSGTPMCAPFLLIYILMSNNINNLTLANSKSGRTHRSAPYETEFF